MFCFFSLLLTVPWMKSIQRSWCVCAGFVFYCCFRWDREMADFVRSALGPSGERRRERPLALWSAARAAQGRQGELSGYTASTCQGKGGLSLFLSSSIPPPTSPSPLRFQALHLINRHIHVATAIYLLYLCNSMAANSPQDMQSRPSTIASIIQRTRRLAVAVTLINTACK